MSSTFEQIQIYTQERLKFFPWFVIPIVIFVLGHGDFKYRYSLLYMLLFGVLFFRVFDDYFCYLFDRIKKKPYRYLENSKKPLLILIITLGVLFLSALSFYNTSLTIVLFFFIGIHIPFYLILKKTHLVVYVSLLKYPMLFLMVFLLTGFGEFKELIWPILGTLFFIGREIAEEGFQYRNTKIEIIVVLILMITKIMIRNNV